MKRELERTRTCAQGRWAGRGMGKMAARNTGLRDDTLGRAARGRNAQTAAAAHLHTTSLQSSSAVLTAAPQAHAWLF